MKKRYGITSDPGRRRELENEFSGVKNFKVEKTFQAKKLLKDGKRQIEISILAGQKHQVRFWVFSQLYPEKTREINKRRIYV